MVALAIMGYYYQRYRDDKGLCVQLEYIGFAFILVFVGLRGFCMFDWYNYYPEFREMVWKDVSTFSLGEDRETLWALFVMVTKTLFHSYHAMVFLQSLLLLSLLWRFFRRETPNVFLSMILFFAFEGFPISFNLLRNSIAIAIFLNAIPYIQKRKPIQFFGLCLLGFGFHYSSVLYMPLYFLLNRRLNKYVFLGYIGFCAVFYCLNIPVFSTLAERLAGGSETAQKAIKAYTDISEDTKLSPIFFEQLATGLLIFCYYDKLHKLRPNATIFINSFLLFISTVFLISDLSEISSRLSTLFIYSYWVLYSDIIRCFSIRNNRRLFMTFVGLYCLFRTAMPMGNPVYKYDNLIFGIESYNRRAAVFYRNVVSHQK